MVIPLLVSTDLKFMFEQIITLRTSEMQQSKVILKTALKLLTGISLSSILQLMPQH